jgi:hypothetical protein
MRHVECNWKTEMADLRGSLTASSSILAAVLAVLVLAPVAAHAEACPNEQLRVEDHSTSLPDCRAYEQVTPPFKYGQEAYLTFKQDGIANNGDAITYNSLGGFGEPGDDNGQRGAFYVARRGANGWSSIAVNLPRERFQGLGPPNEGEVSDYSANLSESLTIQAPVGSTVIDKRIYRVPVGGTPVEVGPTIEPAKAATYSPQDVEEGKFPIPVYVGAGANLEHVFFGLENKNGLGDWFWNGDATDQGRLSLYEYSGPGDSEPELVGVRGGPGSKELISECGTYIGGVESQGYGGSTDSYNAISENGDIVFLSAATACAGASPTVTELYARLDGSETVAISEPSKEDCSACDTSKAAQEAGKVAGFKYGGALFQGANQAGTRVFFLSAQALLPGAKGDNLYEYDFEAPKGEKVSLVAPDMAPADNFGLIPGGVARVSEDGMRVVFVSEDSALATNRDANGKTAAEEAEAGRGSLDLYAFNALSDRLVFIAALAPGDQEVWQLRDARPVDATANGRFVVFLSAADLTPGTDAEGRQQVYLYDAQSGEEEAQDGVASSKSLVRVSIGQQSPGGYYCPSTKRIEAGFNCNGNSNGGVGIPARNFESASFAHPLVSAVSENGAVFFSSTGALTPQATNEQVVGCTEEEAGSCLQPSVASNVYEYEDGQVYLLAVGSAHEELFGADPSGENVFFTTSEPLVGQDTDTGQDLYDARVDGGFPAPVTPAECKGETCQAPVGPAPVLGAPASAMFAGPGNLSPSPAAVTPKKQTAAEIKAEQLAKALKQCRKAKKKANRTSCEKRARQKYGTAKEKKAKRASRDRRPSQ